MQVDGMDVFSVKMCVEYARQWTMSGERVRASPLSNSCMNCHINRGVRLEMSTPGLLGRGRASQRASERYQRGRAEDLWRDVCDSLPRWHMGSRHGSHRARDEETRTHLLTHLRTLVHRR